MYLKYKFLFFLCSFALTSGELNKCMIMDYECPSKYLCVAEDGGHVGHCICDRFYGFYGPMCSKLALASYILVACCGLGVFLMMRALFFNISLAYRLYVFRHLGPNAIGRSLFFNLLLIVPSIGLCFGFMFPVVQVDEDMYFHEFLRLPMYTLYFGTYILTAMSISLVWVETVEKSSSSRSNKANKKSINWKYKSILYGTSVVSIFASCLSYRYNFTAFFGLVLCVMVAYSYHYASQRVVKALSTTDVNGSIIVHPSAMDILNTIKSTAKEMTRLSMWMALLFLGLAFTITLSRPFYEKQNHLPRYAQGQIFFFLVTPLPILPCDTSSSSSSFFLSMIYVSIYKVLSLSLSLSLFLFLFCCNRSVGALIK
jgi:hypothetical protein